jgi:hypothetical protein
VLLLSRTLPASVPLPSSAQDFFLHVFDKARHYPDVCTMKPVYYMLNGACRNLMSLLSEKKREQFDQVLSHILSSNEAGKNCMLMLWCCGIMLLAERAEENVERQKLQSSLDLTATSSGRKMFGSPSKVYKTINLAYLSVIYATKGDAIVPDEDAVEGIRIALRTLRCVDRMVLKDWPTSSPLAKGTFTKLETKILQPKINPAVQLEALCFYSIAAGEGNFPSEIVTQYERCLTKVADLVDSDRLGPTLLISLPIYSVRVFSHSV